MQYIVITMQILSYFQWLQNKKIGSKNINLAPTFFFIFWNWLQLLNFQRKPCIDVCIWLQYVQEHRYLNQNLYLTVTLHYKRELMWFESPICFPFRLYTHVRMQSQNMCVCECTARICAGPEYVRVCKLSEDMCVRMHGQSISSNVKA